MTRTSNSDLNQRELEHTFLLTDDQMRMLDRYDHTTDRERNRGASEKFGFVDPNAETETESESQTEESKSGSYQVRIQYSGERSGSISAGGSSRSIDGSGSETIDIEGDPSILAANAQKQGDDSDELTIQILEDGEVVKESSTSAEYDMAQVALSGSGGGGAGDGEGANFAMVVKYSGSWQGSISTDGSGRSVQGGGDKTIEIEGSPNIISVNAQKGDDSSDELTVQITKDGEVVEEASTSAEYGVARVSYSNY